MPFPDPTGGGGAPADADYLVGTANAGLSAEIVAGPTPGGELGGTWPAPTVDGVHSGTAHHAQAHAIGGADHSGTITAAQHAALGPIVGAHGHDDLDTVLADQHHAQAHALGGADHTGGITAAQHGALGPIVGAHGHDDLDTVGIDDHHARDHGITGVEHIGFPGGTTTFLRADETFAAPVAAAADVAYSQGSVTVVTETIHFAGNHSKLTTTQRITLQGTGRWSHEN